MTEATLKEELGIIVARGSSLAIYQLYRQTIIFPNPIKQFEAGFTCLSQGFYGMYVVCHPASKSSMYIL